MRSGPGGRSGRGDRAVTAGSRPAARGRWAGGAAVLLAAGLASTAAVSAPAEASAPRDGAHRAAPVEPGRVLRVGPGRELRSPSDAARIARDGDTVEIDAGIFVNDHAHWRQHRLTLRGVGGPAHLASRGAIPNRKAIWIIDGDDVAIEHIEFSGAAVADGNGAGIRHQGGDLRLNNTFFHDNEFSILTGRLPGATIEITASRFWFQRRPHRHSHGIYIGDVRRLRLVGNHFTGTDRGHQVKSRARENWIAYNRIEDAPRGNSSRLIDLPNCGLSVVIGNDLHQAATTENDNAIGYGAEGCAGRGARETRLYVVHNSFINEARSGVFVRNYADGDASVANNLVFGAGRLLAGRGRARANLQLPLAAQSGLSWVAPERSGAVDAAVRVPAPDGLSLVPTREFDAPAGTRTRPRAGPLDIGAREAR